MIPLPLIHIGTRLRTNRGNIITVASISTKRQHRKVGYHTPEDPCHIKYVRLIQCTEIVPIPSFDITPGYYLCRINGRPYTPMLVLRYDGEFWFQYFSDPLFRGWIGADDLQFEPIQKVADEPK